MHTGGMTSRADITAAHARIAGDVRHTPLLRLDNGWCLKLESLQRGGSFKVRGAFNRLRRAGDLSAGVVAASGGNHGVAVALAAGRPVDVEVGGVAADSLGARQVGGLMFPIAAAHVAQSVLVADEAIIAAQRWLWAECQVVAEPGGATALAALLSGAWVPPPGARVGVLVCGGNCAPGSVAPGLVASGSVVPASVALGADNLGAGIPGAGDPGAHGARG